MKNGSFSILPGTAPIVLTRTQAVPGQQVKQRTIHAATSQLERKSRSMSPKGSPKTEKISIIENVHGSYSTAQPIQYQNLSKLPPKSPIVVPDGSVKDERKVVKITKSEHLPARTSSKSKIPTKNSSSSADLKSRSRDRSSSISSSKKSSKTPSKFSRDQSRDKSKSHSSQTILQLKDFQKEREIYNQNLEKITDKIRKNQSKIKDLEIDSRNQVNLIKNYDQVEIDLENQLSKIKKSRNKLIDRKHDNQDKIFDLRKKGKDYWEEVVH